MKKRTRIHVLGATVAIAFALVLVLAPLAYADSGTCEWNGVHGADNNLAGASTLWILTGGGSGTFTSATLDVTYSNGHTESITGEVKGAGAVHFVVPANDSATVSAAIAHYEADGAVTNCVLTISHVISESTTTTVEESTTTTAEETTSTTAEDTTSTTEEGLTTTTGGMTTVSEIQTGAGAPAGPSAATWALVGLAGLMASGVALTGARRALRRH